MSFASVWITLPNTHWPMSLGSIFARATASLHDARAELGRRDVLQAAAVVADGRPHAGKDDDFSSVAHRCLLAVRRRSPAPCENYTPGARRGRRRGERTVRPQTLGRAPVLPQANEVRSWEEPT